jgi:hypothetical protein
MVNEQLANRTTRPIVQSDSTVISPPLKGIVLLEGGALHYRDTAGNEVTKTFPTMAGGGIYPFVFEMRIDKVFDTGTVITDDQMIGFS